jgi:hypothetical protein
MSFFGEIRISDFDEDRPASLEPYGLDRPAARILIQGEEETLELLFGKSNGTQQFAKLPDNPGVFLIRDVSPALKALAFDLIDRSVASPLIERVDSVTVRGGGGTISAAVDRRDGDEGTVYSLNGREISEDSFRAFFGACVSLSVDAEYPGSAKPAAAEITIEYGLNEPAGEKIQARFAPYNRDFYALVNGGPPEFLVSRQQIQKIFAAADKAE